MSSIIHNSLPQSPFHTEISAQYTRVPTTTITTKENQNLTEMFTTKFTSHNKTAVTTPAIKTVTKDQAPSHPLDRVYHPSKDDHPIEELLARPRLQLPWDPLLNEGSSNRGGYFNARTMKPLRRAALMGASGNGGLEEEKKRTRALALEMRSLTLPEERLEEKKKNIEGEMQ